MTRAIGRVLTGPTLQAVNTFDAADTIRPRSFDDASVEKAGVTVKLPAASVVALTLS